MSRLGAMIARFGPVLLFAIAALLAGGAAQPKPTAADNPLFVAWSRFDVGASATLTGWENDDPTRGVGSRITEKLVKKEADSVTIESTTSLNMGNGWDAGEPRQETILRKWEPRQQMKWLPDEKVKAAGKTFACKVCQGISQYKTVWLSDEVPGGVVKTELNTPGGSMMWSLTSYSKK